MSLLHAGVFGKVLLEDLAPWTSYNFFVHLLLACAKGLFGLRATGLDFLHIFVVSQVEKMGWCKNRSGGPFEAVKAEYIFESSF